MTEVKHKSNTAGLALYATQEYQPGQIILTEKPLVVLAPKSADQVKALRCQFQNVDSDATKNMIIPIDSPLCDLKLPTSITESLSSSTSHDDPINLFRGMLIAAASFALEENEDIKRRFLELYHPNPNISLNDKEIPLEDSSSTGNCNENEIHERGIVSLAQQAVQYLQQEARPLEPLGKLVKSSPEDCCKVMLIWCCNAFKGGYVYETMSRVNHSCDFNAVVSSTAATAGEGGGGAVKDSQQEESITKDGQPTQILRAASLIHAGDEICISYLGSYTYADFILRNERLKKEKFFVCQCERCEEGRAMGDVAGSIPCPVCHPRLCGGRYLEEDVQYDDGEVEVHYCIPCWAVKDDGKVTCYKCDKCGVINAIDPSVSNTMEKTLSRAISHLDQGLVEHCEIDDEEEERATKIEMTERLASLASSVLGSRHWATILVTFVMLSAKLSLIHATMLCRSVQGSGSESDDKRNDNSTDDSDESGLMTDVAECVDSLERIMEYVESLKLKSHVGHLVGNVAVGVARALIGFGDVKSMKYGSTFASRVYDDYFKLGYEGEAMEKVVDTLINAWKRKVGGNDDAEGREQKRQKKSIN
jgi:hypothetical protein